MCSIPRGSVIKPVDFVAYAGDVISHLSPIGQPAGLYADEMQIYASSGPIYILSVRRNKRSCIAGSAALCQWFAFVDCMQINPNRTDIIWFDS